MARLSGCRNSEVWAYLTFEIEVVLREPKAVMGVDVSFNNVTHTIVNLDGNLVSMGTVLFDGLKRALAHKTISESIQKKYSRKWRYVKGIRESVRRHGERTRNIPTDSCHFLSRKVIDIAKEHSASALIVLENLNKLRKRTSSSRKFNKELSLWAYRRIQSYIAYKALIEGIQVLHADPRNTSKTSPIGGGLEFINYRWIKLPSGHSVTRDIIASWNLALRGLEVLTRYVGSGGSVDSPKAPNQIKKG